MLQLRTYHLQPVSQTACPHISCHMLTENSREVDSMQCAFNRSNLLKQLNYFEWIPVKYVTKPIGIG